MSRLLLISALSISLLGSAALAQSESGGKSDGDFIDQLGEPAKGFFTDDKQLRSEEEIKTNFAALDVEQKQSMKSRCVDGQAKGNLSHAMIELCAWIGQYR